MKKFLLSVEVHSEEAGNKLISSCLNATSLIDGLVVTSISVFDEQLVKETVIKNAVKQVEELLRKSIN